MIYTSGLSAYALKLPFVGKVLRIDTFGRQTVADGRTVKFNVYY